MDANCDGHNVFAAATRQAASIVCCAAAMYPLRLTAGVDGYQRHVLLECPDGDNVRDLYDRHIAELLAKDGRVSWPDPARRDHALERDVSCKKDVLEVICVRSE